MSHREQTQHCTRSPQHEVHLHEFKQRFYNMCRTDTKPHVIQGKKIQTQFLYQLDLAFVTYSIKYRLHMICTSLHSVLIYVEHNEADVHRNWVCKSDFEVSFQLNNFELKIK